MRDDKSMMTHAVSDRLSAAGAAVVGCADLAPVDETTRQGFPGAVSFAMPLTPAIVAGIAEGPTEAYSQEYSRLNTLLTRTAQDIAAFIETRGWKAHARPASGDWSAATLRAPFQHKTAATLAGLGWIGKCALLATPGFGPAVRWASVPTDAPLTTGTPVFESRCGDCTACVDICPALMLKGGTAMGVPLPNAWLGGIKNIDLLKQAGQEAGF